MTAWIWLYCEEHPPYGSCGDDWRFDVATVAEARAICAAVRPDAPKLGAWVTIDCDKGQCPTRIRFLDGAVAGVVQAREYAARYQGGWTVGVRGGKVVDLCPLHDRESVGQAPADAPADDSRQLDLFGGAA